MKTIYLEARPDEYDDTLGFVIAGTQDFEGLSADRSGLLIAHDILEHQNGVRHMGTVWDELEALGGVYQVRARHGDLLQDRPSAWSIAHNLASDVTRMFEEWTMEADPPGGLAVGSRAHLHDDDFREVLAIARQDIPRETGDWDAERQECLESYLTLALHRMRAGFRKAERRFGPGYRGVDQFIAIRDAVKSAVREVEYEGQRFRLRYGAGEATCHEVYQEDEE